jgi:uncharacterized protein (DUF427 family)
MSTEIRIFPAEGTWVVRADGAVVAESRAALEVTVGEAPFVIYFPRADVAMAFVEPSGKVSACPQRGQAVHFDIVASSGVLADAGWSYDAPPADFARLAGHLAFDAAKVTVERI